MLLMIDNYDSFTYNLVRSGQGIWAAYIYTGCLSGASEYRPGLWWRHRAREAVDARQNLHDHAPG